MIDTESVERFARIIRFASLMSRLVTVVELTVMHRASIVVQVLQLCILADLLVLVQNRAGYDITGDALSGRKNFTYVYSVLLFVSIAVLSAELAPFHLQLIDINLHGFLVCGP